MVVVPAARARHREGLAQRRPDIRHSAQAARNRMRTVISLTGGRRLLWVLPQLVLITLAEVLAAAVMGRVRQAGAALSALGGLFVRLPAIFARRRQVAQLREVPDTEVAGLQVRGSTTAVELSPRPRVACHQPDASRNGAVRRRTRRLGAGAGLAVGAGAVHHRQSPVAQLGCASIR